MMTREDAVAEFQTAMEQPINAPITDHESLKLALKLIAEEYKELAEAAVDANANPTLDNMAALLKELSDLQYVVSFFANTFGLPLQAAFERVHASNMTKLVDGKPLKNEEGKVMKGPNYRPPYLKDLFLS